MFKVHVISGRLPLNPQLILTGVLVLPVLGQVLSLWQQKRLRVMCLLLLKIHKGKADISGRKCIDDAYTTLQRS